MNIPRISDIRFSLQTRTVVIINRILLRHEHVHSTIRVAGKAVGVPASLTEVLDVVGCSLCAQSIVCGIGAEVLRFDAVKIVGREWGVVHDVTVKR